MPWQMPVKAAGLQNNGKAPKQAQKIFLWAINTDDGPGPRGSFCEVRSNI